MLEVFGQARGPKLPGSRPAPIRVWVHSQEGDIGAGSELLPYVSDSRVLGAQTVRASAPLLPKCTRRLAVTAVNHPRPPFSSNQ